jgi:Bacterial regulatory helix-turn-helix protein, lysR family
MELHQLRYFCAVAHNGNITHAAKAENVAQPHCHNRFGSLKLNSAPSFSIVSRALQD